MGTNRKILLLLTRFPDRGSKAFEFFTGCRYPHASIGLEEDPGTFYSFVAKGFIVESIARYVRPDREPFPCQLYELEVPERVYRKVKEIISYFITFRSMMCYTKLGVVLGLLNIPHRKNHFKYFCTQFVAHVLHRSGAVRLRKKSWRCFADDLKSLPGMRLAHQGNMKTMLLARCAIPVPCA